MIFRRFAALSLAGLAGAIAVTGLLPAPHLADIAQTLLGPRPQIEKPEMPVFAAAEGKTGRQPDVRLTEPPISLTNGTAYVVLAFPAAHIACKHGICTGVVIKAYRSGPRLDFKKRGHESMVEGFAGYPPS